jgi:hypothetical protein
MSEGTFSRAQAKAVAAMRQALDWAYDHATEAIPGVGSAAGVAEKHLKAAQGDPEKAINTLIARHTAYAGATGFVTNLGGAITLPVTIPANIASVLALQLRLVAAIAHLRRYDASDPRVKTMAFLCLTGTGAATVLEEVGVTLGKRLSSQIIGGISQVAFPRIQHAVSQRLATAAGVAGVVNMGRVLPIVGGAIGGVFDAAVTRGIGAAAKTVFVPVDAAPK